MERGGPADGQIGVVVEAAMVGGQQRSGRANERGIPRACAGDAGGGDGRARWGMSASCDRLYVDCADEPVADDAAPTMRAGHPLSPSSLRGSRYRCRKFTRRGKQGDVEECMASCTATAVRGRSSPLSSPATRSLCSATLPHLAARKRRRTSAFHRPWRGRPSHVWR